MTVAVKHSGVAGLDEGAGREDFEERRIGGGHAAEQSGHDDLNYQRFLPERHLAKSKSFNHKV